MKALYLYKSKYSKKYIRVWEIKIFQKFQKCFPKNVKLDSYCMPLSTLLLQNI